MKPNWNHIFDLIRSDIICMNGGKKTMRTTFIILFVLCLLGVIFLSPLLILYAPLCISGFFIPMVFQNEMKYHSEKMFSIIPVPRHELVTARYVLAMGFYVIFAVISYLLMCLSFQLHLYLVVDGKDVVELMVKMTSNGLSSFEYCNLIFFGVTAFSMSLMSDSLRNYFKDNTRFSGKVTFGKKMSKTDIRQAAFWLTMFVIFFLFITGTLPIGQTGYLVFSLIGKLAEVMHGVMLSLAFLIIGIMMFVLNYVRTQIAYEQKEL